MSRIFVDEVLNEILLNSDLQTIKNLCMIDKNAKLLLNRYFWYLKYKKEHLYYFDNMKFTLSEYEMIKDNLKKIKIMQHKSIRLNGNFIDLIQLEDYSLIDIIKNEYGDLNIYDTHMLWITLPNLMIYRIIGSARMFEVSHPIKNISLLLSKIFYLHPHVSFVIN